MSTDERREALLGVIRGARTRLSLSLFRCNDEAVFSELAAATARGVAVEVLVTSRASGGRKKIARLWRDLEGTGAALHAYADSVVKYHAKYLIADDGPAVVASLNFTRKCFQKTCDALVITYDPGVVFGLRQIMAADCEGRAVPADLADRLIVGPERARRQFTALIGQARSSIRVIDAKLSDPDIEARLNARRDEGLIVEIINAKRLGDLKSHGKIMLIDESRVVVGSLALDTLSLDFHREVAISVTDPAAVAVAVELFRAVQRGQADADGHSPATAAR